MSNLDDLLKSLKPTEHDIENAYNNEPNMAEVRATEYIKRYNELEDEFEYKTSLNRIDLGAIIGIAGLQCIRWWLLKNDSLRFQKAADSDKFFNGLARSEFMPATLEQIILDHRVPYDAQRVSEGFSLSHPLEAVDMKLGGGYHRSKTLGHDPLAGLVVGTANIATNTLTKADFPIFSSYHVEDSLISGMTNIGNVMQWTYKILLDKPEVIGASFIKQVVHSTTDMFTPLGLPVPGISTISPELSRRMVGARIDTYAVTRGVVLAILINKLGAMFHRLFYNPSTDNERLYEAKTRKVLMYSNVASSIINIGYVGISKDARRFDLGGLLVTLWRIFSDRRKIKEIKEEFITGVLHNEYQREADKARKELADIGISLDF